MSAHTPTPWRLHEQFGADIYSDARGGWFVATTSASGHPGGPGDGFFGQERIDASHIVRCVNAYASQSARIAALEAALRIAREVYVASVDLADDDDTLTAIDAALAGDTTT